jgi:hypothetical protein
LSQSGQDTQFPGIHRQNLISIRGHVYSYAGTIELSGFGSEDITVIDGGVPLPTPAVIATGDTTAQQAILQTSSPGLCGTGTRCRATGTITRAEGGVGGGTNIYVDDGSGELYVRVWDASHLDSVFLYDRYYHLGELVGVACTIYGVSESYNGTFELEAGYAEDFVQALASGPHTITLPEGFSLAQNYPNPFNSTSVLEYQLPARAQIELNVFDLLGRKVEVVFVGSMSAGIHRATIDGSRLASGNYYVQLSSKEVHLEKRIVLVK